MKNLEERIVSALRAYCDNKDCLHIPARDTDIDVVLGDALKQIKDLKQQIKELQASRESLLEYKNKIESGEFVLVPKSDLQTWYFDEFEGMWLDKDGIDGGLSEIEIGEIAEVKKQKQYSIEVPNTFIALPWVDGEVGDWQEYATKEEAEKVAKYCKQMFDADGV